MLAEYNNFIVLKFSDVQICIQFITYLTVGEFVITGINKTNNFLLWNFDFSIYGWDILTACIYCAKMPLS